MKGEPAQREGIEARCVRRAALSEAPSKPPPRLPYQRPMHKIKRNHWSMESRSNWGHSHPDLRIQGRRGPLRKEKV